MTVFMSLLPLALMVILITVLKWPVWKSVTVTLASIVIICALYFDTPAQTLINAVLYGLLKGFWPIVLVIFAAIYSYRVMDKTGSIEVLRGCLSRVSDDERIQLLLISWCFGSFLEGAAGFSTAVAIPVGILCALGFNPVRASLATLVANTVATPFGAVGTPTLVMTDQLQLLNHTPLGVSALTVLMLSVLNIIIPFVMIYVLTGKWRAFKGIFLLTLMTGLANVIPQWLIAAYLGPQLTAFGGALVSLLVLLWMVKCRNTPTPEEYKVKMPVMTKTAPDKTRIWQACSIYALMFLFILASSPLVPSLRALLTSVVTFVPFTLADGVVLTAKIDWIATPGVLILFATAIGGYFVEKATVADFAEAFLNTIKQLWSAAIAICLIVAIATLMDVAGLLTVISEPLLALTGKAYPYIAPLIGALGCFVTGSVTNANVLCGGLQVSAAHALNLDPVWLTAANSAGATAAKMIAPQSIAIAISSAGLVGMDAALMRASLKWSAGYLAILTVTVGLLIHFLS